MKKLLLVVLVLSIFSLHSDSAAYTPMVNEAACKNYCSKKQISVKAANKYNERSYLWIPHQKTQANNSGPWQRLGIKSRSINTGKCACLSKDGWFPVQ